MTEFQAEAIVGALVRIARALESVQAGAEATDTNQQELIAMVRESTRLAEQRRQDEEEHRVTCPLCRGHFYPVQGQPQ